jgi:hypothetical protein
MTACRSILSLPPLTDAGITSYMLVQGSLYLYRSAQEVNLSDAEALQQFPYQESGRPFSCWGFPVTQGSSQIVRYRSSSSISQQLLRFEKPRNHWKSFGHDSIATSQSRMLQSRQERFCVLPGHRDGETCVAALMTDMVPYDGSMKAKHSSGYSHRHIVQLALGHLQTFTDPFHLVVAPPSLHTPYSQTSPPCLPLPDPIRYRQVLHDDPLVQHLFQVHLE